MNLTIEATDRCKYCHPETCNCPDYQLMLNGECISSGNFDRLKKVKEMIEQALDKAASDEREACAQLCDREDPLPDGYSPDREFTVSNTVKECARLIRTRTQK